MTIRSRLGASARGTPRVPPASSGGQGTQGPAGPQGARGAQGFQGSAGGAGAQGAQGFQGSGAQGAQGGTGVQGFQGAQGTQGAQGFQGATGIVAQANIYLTGQTGAIGATNVFGSLPAAGLYRISAYLDVVTAGTAGTLSTRINFTPDDGVASFSIATSPLAVSAVGGASGEVIVESAGAAQITYEVDTALFTAGSLAYSLRIVGEKLTP